MPFRKRSLVGLTVSLLCLAGCGGASQGGSELLPQLRAAMGKPVDSMDQSKAHSRLVEDALESNALSGMNRAEVEAAIGRGDECSRHPRCAEQNFQNDDWYYDVGTLGAGGAQLPVLIVGFDHTGHVTRTWNLRTDE